MCAPVREGFRGAAGFPAACRSLSDSSADIPASFHPAPSLQVQVIGAPGMDFLSPIGTSGVTAAVAINPCIGAHGGRRRRKGREAPTTTRL